MSECGRQETNKREREREGGKKGCATPADRQTDRRRHGGHVRHRGRLNLLKTTTPRTTPKPLSISDGSGRKRARRGMEGEGGVQRHDATESIIVASKVASKISAEGKSHTHTHTRARTHTPKQNTVTPPPPPSSSSSSFSRPRQCYTTAREGEREGRAGWQPRRIASVDRPSLAS